MTLAKRTEGIRVFLIIWFGQVVSLLGSGLTSFALGVWVYQRTGSVTKFALILFFAALPGIVLSPIAGAIVDRWDRRRIIILSDAMAALTSAILLVLLWDESRNLLSIWHIYALMVIASFANALHEPAYASATTLLVPKQHYGRASGLVQMGDGIARIAAPAIAGVMLLSVGLRGILIADLATFGFAVLTLLVVRVRQSEWPATTARSSLLQEAAVGWAYLRQRPGLLALLAVFVVHNFATGMLQCLLPPLVLSFASSAALGTILSSSGAGMLVGTLIMGIWGGPRRRIYGVFAGLMIEGLILLVAGWRPSVLLVGTAAFIYLLVTPMVIGCSQAMWQSKVPPPLQGRVFALRRMIVFSSLPVAYLLAGPLADRVFEPLLAPGGTLADSVGGLIGVGQGRGIALLFVLLGVLVVAGLPLIYTYRPLRNIENEMPDAVPGVEESDRSLDEKDVIEYETTVERC
jgi:MFS transporter, DHA3 family, macrolide efflux protein